MEEEYNVGFTTTFDRTGAWGESSAPIQRLEKAERWLNQMKTMWPDAVLLKRNSPNEPWEKVEV